MEPAVESEKPHRPKLVKPSKWEQRVRTLLLVWIGFIASLLLLRVWTQPFPLQAVSPMSALRPIIAEYTYSNPQDAVNFASKFNGAQINYANSSPQLHGAFSWMSSSSLASLLSDDNSPGSCWAFGGSSGYATIELSGDILVSGVSLHHPSLLHSDSAPREFKVWTIDWPETRLLVHDAFEIQTDHDKRQQWQEFRCTEHCERPVRTILLEILSNYGAENTCVYQFIVNGAKLSK